MTAAEWDELPPVLTPEQVARVLGISRMQVIRWAHAGTIPAVKLSGQWRFSKAALAGTPDEHGAGAGGPTDR